MFENKDELIQYLKENHLYTNKSLGQNFLVDNEALEKIVNAGEIKPTDTVLEIGPGMGVLTEKLAEKAGKVIAIELDKKLYELLVESRKLKVESGNLQIINANALDFDLSSLKAKSYKLIANIPYYITSKILEKFLIAENKPESIVLLVQKEVAERICAKPGDMSVLSISVQAFGEPEVVDIIKAESFFPAPKVDSAILKVKSIKWPHFAEATRGKKVESVGEKDFFRTVKIGFAARRKTLLNNLSAGFCVDKGTILNILKNVKLNENIRAQELSISAWEQLTTELINLNSK
jgi:16S rRNA (adenine1518-N6/adenine1519-N6)-dimethyltransferase